MRLVPTLEHADACAAADAVRADIARQGKTAVIAVCDAHGELILLHRLDGAPLSSIAVATNKALTAARLRRPSAAVGDAVRERGIDIGYYGDPRYVGFGGGVPIERDGVVVGGIGVSGLAEDEDRALAALGAAAAVARGSGG
jgi:glc operon protein GlcG